MSFEVEILFGGDAPSSWAAANGEDVHTVTQEERAAFGISDQVLTDAISAYFGHTPTQLFLCDPTPGNWYAGRSWEQVSVHLRPIEAMVVDVSAEPVILKTQTFTNASGDKSGMFDVSIMVDRSDTVESNWSNTKSIGGSLTIGYKAKFFNADVTVDFRTDFQNGGSRSHTVAIGQSSGVMVELGPHESVQASLSASQGSMKVRIVFEAFLSGVIAAYYEKMVKYKHVWPIDINGALEAINIPGRFRIINEVDIGCFSGRRDHFG